MTINSCVPANFSKAECSLLLVTTTAAVITAIVIGVITHWSTVGYAVGGALAIGTPSVILLGICINSCRSNRAGKKPWIIKKIRHDDVKFRAAGIEGMFTDQIIRGVPGGKELTVVERFAMCGAPGLPQEFNVKLEPLKSYFESQEGGLLIDGILVSQPPEGEKIPVAELLAAVLIDENTISIQPQNHFDNLEQVVDNIAVVYGRLSFWLKKAGADRDNLYFVVIDNIEVIFDTSPNRLNSLVEFLQQDIATQRQQNRDPGADHSKIEDLIKKAEVCLKGARDDLNKFRNTPDIIRQLAALPNVFLVGYTRQKQECLDRIGGGLFQVELDIPAQEL